MHRAVMERARVGTLVVIAGDWHLKGLLTERDLQFCGRPFGDGGQPHDAAQSPLVTFTGRATEVEAAAAMAAHRVKKLPLVDQSGRLIGLVTARDLVRQRELPFATRDDQGRLRVGAAIGAPRRLPRASRGVDSRRCGRAGHRHRTRPFRGSWSGRSTEVRSRFPRCGRHRRQCRDGRWGPLPRRSRRLCGESRHRSRWRLHDPPSPPASACRSCMPSSSAGRRLVDQKFQLIADGGIKRHGAIALALMCGGNTVMLGSAFAGTDRGARRHRAQVGAAAGIAEDREGPVQGAPRHGVDRGHQATGSTSRTPAPSTSQAIGAEGMEVSVPAARVGAARAAGDDEAPVLVDQLRGRGEPAGSVAAPPGRSGTIPGEAERVVTTGVLRSMTRTLATALRLGLATLRLNPLRTSLSTLGIIMGAASLAAVLALGDGACLAPIDAIQRE